MLAAPICRLCCVGIRLHSRNEIDCCENRHLKGVDDENAQMRPMLFGYYYPKYNQNAGYLSCYNGSWLTSRVCRQKSKWSKNSWTPWWACCVVLLLKHNKVYTGILSSYARSNGFHLFFLRKCVQYTPSRYLRRVQYSTVVRTTQRLRGGQTPLVEPS